MKRICCYLLTFVLLLGNTAVFADRNEDRRKQETASKPKQEQIPNLPAKLASELDGCLVIKTENSIIYESGKGVKSAYPAFNENDKIFIPAAQTAEFFGKKAVWIAEIGSVKIDEQIIHPSETSVIKDGRTMIESGAMAGYVGAEVVYKGSDTVILSKKKIAQSVIDKTVAALRDKFYVSPSGSSGGDGSLENPFGSIKEAVSYLRGYTAAGMNTNITVYLRGGLYTNNEAIKFTSADSGKNGFTITYKSYPGETAEIAAAKEVKGWKPYKDGIYMAEVDASEEINVLYEGDIFAHKARYPNLGDGAYRDYYLHSAGYNESNPKTFYFNKGDLPYISDAEGLQAVIFGGGENGFINWWMEAFNAQIDYRKKSLTLSTDPVRVMGPGSRYFIQGSLELLDSEGEFYYDKNAKVIYYKPYGKDINSETITYPTVVNPIILEGTEADPIKNIVFDNIKVGKSNTNTELRAASDEAIYFKYAENCAMRNSEILLTGNDGIVLINTKNCDVSGNYIHDIGAVGVKTDADYLYGEVKYSGNTINNNYIKNIGILKREASGIVLKNTDYGTVMYNHIESTPRMAILFGTGYMACMFIGQTFGGKTVDVDNQFDFVNCMGNVIAYNDVTDVMTDSQDGGAIYGWGSGKYNRVENNHVHDTDMHKISDHPTYFPLYNDDSNGYTIYNKNIVDNNQLNGNGQMIAPMFIKSVGNEITNNFVLNNPASIRSAISTHADIDDPGNNNICTNNLVMNSGDRLHGQYSWKSDRFKQCDYNMYYNENGKYMIYGIDLAKTYDQWKKMPTDNGYMDTHSISGENPSFVDYDGRDYRLRYDSDAFKVGIEDIDEKDIGVKADFRFADREEEIKKLYLETSSDGLSANVRINAGESTQIIPSVRTVSGYFANLDNAKITYKSSNENAAIVDESGIVTGTGSGIAEITVTVEKAEKTISSKLYVLVGDNMESLEINIGSAVIDNGKTTNVLATGKSSMGYTIPVTDITYESSDKTVAEIDENGNITALKPGSATITATAAYKGRQCLASSAPIKVLDGVIDKISVTAEKTDAILVGESIQLNVEATLSNGKSVNNSEMSIKYMSGDENIIKVDENGVMTGSGEGRTSVTVALEKDGFGKTYDVQVSVFEKYSGTLGNGFKEINFGTSYGYADFRSDGSILMRSTGEDFYGEADDGYYLYKDITNENVTIEMKVNSLYQTSNNTAVGITIRESASAESKNYTIRTLRGGTVISVWRKENGGGSGYTEHGSGKFPLKLKIEKKGNSIKSYVDFGSGYKEAYNMSLDVGKSYTVGLPMFSQSNMSTEAVISDLVITE